MLFHSTPYGKFLHSFRGDLISCARFGSRDCTFLYITESVGVEPGILILSPVVTARMGLQVLQWSEKCHKGINRCERRRN